MSVLILNSFLNIFFQSETHILFDNIKYGLEDRIRRLEEDRHNDFSSEFWYETVLKNKRNKKSIDIFGEKKKKPCNVNGPYIVYMLSDVDIMEDWTAVKKILAAPKRKCVDPFVF
jgi:breast cancer metastasis-suppressor 1-like protein